MRLFICALLFFFTELPNYIFCKSFMIEDSNENNYKEKDLWRIFATISRARESLPVNRRSSRKDQVKYFYEALSNTGDIDKFKNWLREEAAGHVEDAPAMSMKDEIAGLVENELLNALSKKSSALLDRPYVQKKGRNDFLVIRSDISDPFVTIVPNDIYYNVEKKCINWLDDCNLKGIRNRLLQKVNSPYK